MTDKLIEMAERCEGASDTDAMSRTMRALNADILRATGWREAEGDVIDPRGNLRMQVPFYVGSLDAALTLVPEGWMHGYSSFSLLDAFAPGAFQAWVSSPPADLPSLQDNELCGRGEAVTPALALCAAALRARATLHPNPKGEA